MLDDHDCYGLLVQHAAHDDKLKNNKDFGNYKPSCLSSLQAAWSRLPNERIRRKAPRRSCNQEPLAAVVIGMQSRHRLSERSSS
jgi:hypothetical protein